VLAGVVLDEGHLAGIERARNGRRVHAGGTGGDPSTSGPARPACGRPCWRAPSSPRNPWVCFALVGPPLSGCVQPICKRSLTAGAAVPRPPARRSVGATVRDHRNGRQQVGSPRSGAPGRTYLFAGITVPEVVTVGRARRPTGR
jgi:hypothetical protein